MKKLSDLIYRRLHDHHIGDAAKASVVLSKANQLLVDRFSFSESDIKAYKLNQSVLYFSVSGPLIHQEFKGVEQQLLGELSTLFGRQIQKICVKNLTF